MEKSDSIIRKNPTSQYGKNEQMNMENFHIMNMEKVSPNKTNINQTNLNENNINENNLTENKDKETNPASATASALTDLVSSNISQADPQNETQEEEDIWGKPEPKPEVEHLPESLRITPDLSGNKPKTEKEKLEEFERGRKQREEALRDLRAKKAKEDPFADEQNQDFVDEHGNQHIFNKSNMEFVIVDDKQIPVEFYNQSNNDEEDESDMPY